MLHDIETQNNIGYLWIATLGLIISLVTPHLRPTWNLLIDLINVVAPCL